MHMFTHIRQVAALLGYEEPQVLEMFTNTSYKFILDTIPYRRPQAGSRNS